MRRSTVFRCRVRQIHLDRATVDEAVPGRANLATAKHDGKKAVLLKVKTADGAHFVALPLPKA